MNTLHNVAAVATPVVGLAFTTIAAYVANLFRNDRKAGQVVADVKKAEADVKAAEPEIKAVETEAEKVPAVAHVVEVVEHDAEAIEAKARAEEERLNAATHGAIDLLAAELVKAVPNAIQTAILAAHAQVPDVTAAKAAEPAPVAAEPAAEPAPASPAPEAVAAPPAPAPGAPISSSTKGSAPA